MPEASAATLSDRARNIVENLAFRLAMAGDSRVRVHDLAPYLPMSLDLIRDCLDAMVDLATVQAEDVDGFRTYLVSGAPPHAEEDEPGSVPCLGCNRSLPAGNPGLCRECEATLQDELNRLAERTGWPARAVYEHEILFLAARHPSPHYAPELAGHSRYTLRRMQDKLKRMTVSGYVRQDVDEANATIAYTFPPLTYPRALYERNMRLIRRHPASITEEVEMKATRIVLALALMLVAVFLLAFLVRIPLPFLLVLYVVLGFLVSLRIWFRREPVPED